MPRRSERLSANIQRAVAGELQKSFPGEYITVTEVEVATDSKFAIIWISILDEKRRDKLFAEVQAKSGALRHSITKNTQMRRVPNIELKLDMRPQHAQRIADLTRDDKLDANQT